MEQVVEIFIIEDKALPILQSHYYYYCCSVVSKSTPPKNKHFQMYLHKAVITSFNFILIDEGIRGKNHFRQKFRWAMTEFWFNYWSTSVHYEGAGTPYPAPMGFYTPADSKPFLSTQIRQATRPMAYHSLLQGAPIVLFHNDFSPSGEQREQRIVAYML